MNSIILYNKNCQILILPKGNIAKREYCQMGNCQMGNCQMGIAKWELPNGNIAKWDTFGKKF